MGLGTDLQALRATKPSTFDGWLEIASEDERAMVLEAINDRALLPNPLATVLRRNGIPVSRETIIRLRAERDAAN